MNIAAAYIRVSTDKQDELSPDAQLRLLKDYAASHDLIIPEEFIFWEIGVSGRKADRRPEFMRMIGLAKSKPSPFQAILVWKFSRFARNQEESIVYKSILNKQCKVEVISASEPLIDGPFGSLIERIIEWMDEYYSIRLSGEVTRGMTEKAMRGEMQCRAAFGYVMRDGHLQVVPEEAEIVQKIFQMFISGKSTLKIARYLNEHGSRTKQGNLWERRSIDYILQNPAYAQIIRWSTDGPVNHGIKHLQELENNNKIIKTKAKHQGIITAEQFNKVQQRLRASAVAAPDQKAPSDTLHKHYLSGIMKCSVCGTGLTFSSRPDWPHFKCRAHLRGTCPAVSSIPLKKATEYLMTALNEAVGGVKLNISQISSSDYNEDLTLLNRRLDQIANKLKRAKDAYLSGIDTPEEYRENKTQLEQERVKANADLQTFLKKLNEPADPAPIRHKVQNLIDLLSNPEISEDIKHDALHAVVDKIIWDKEKQTFEVFYKPLI